MVKGKAIRKEDEDLDYISSKKEHKRDPHKFLLKTPHPSKFIDFSKYRPVDIREFIKTRTKKIPLGETRIYHTRNTRSRKESTCFTMPSDDEEQILDFHFRFHRSRNASLFTTDYDFVEETKFCISSKTGSKRQYITQTGKYCFDSSWVAFHGLYTICMVTRRKAVDMTHLSSYYRQCRNENEALIDFPEAVISEVECIPYKDYEYNHEILRQVVKPFGVVSLPRTTERSWGEAIGPVANFMEQKMKDSRLAFTDYETLQTTIGAFQHMCCGQVFRAEDLWVSILDVSSGRFNHLDIDIITEQLEIVNGFVSCSKSPETPLVLRDRPMLGTPV